MFFSAHDDPGQPTNELIELALSVIAKARSIDLSDLEQRAALASINHVRPNLWPGEHYRLLAAFIEVLQPKRVLEIGTESGLSALAMKARLRPDGQITTFDVVPWQELPTAILRPADFENGRLIQVVGDLSDQRQLAEYRNLLEQCSFIFVDAAKDGILEARLVEIFDMIDFRVPPYILFDDIKTWLMLGVWRRITHPKLDITSFGHFTGTGLVKWSNSC